MGRNTVSEGIRWDKLTQLELDFLERVGVEMLPRGMRFSRQPSWEEFTLAFAYIYAIESRSSPDEDEIAWAIGDCANQGADFFGKEVVDKWLQEFLALLHIRDTILNLAGGTLVLLQQVEDAVKLCVAVLNIEGAGLTIEDFLSDDPKRRRKTLGQLAAALKSTSAFSDEFIERLGRFVDDRNKFAHSLWIEVPKKYPRSGGLPSQQEFEEVWDFLRRLVQEATYFDHVFRGFRYELQSKSMNVEGSGEADNLPLQQWGKYIAEFHNALKQSPAEDPSSDSP